MLTFQLAHTLSKTRSCTINAYSYARLSRALEYLWFRAIRDNNTSIH